MNDIKTYKKDEYWISTYKKFNCFGISNIDKQESIDDLKIDLKLFFNVHRERGTLGNIISGIH